MTERSQLVVCFPWVSELAWCFCWVGHWLGFLGFSTEFNFAVNEGLLGFGPNSRGTQRARCFPLPGLSIVRGRGDGAAWVWGGQGESRKKCHKASGCSHFDASTRKMGAGR